MNEHWFVDLADAEATIVAWRHDYNHNRGRRVAGWKTPAEVAEAAVSAGLQSPPAPSAPLILETLLKNEEADKNRTLQVD